MADKIRVNDNQLSWGSIVLRIAGEDFLGFTSINYGDKRERVKAYGMGRHHAPRGRSRGKYTIEPVKLVGWKSSVFEARDALARQSITGSYGDTEFQIVVMFSEPDEPSITVEINGCVWSNDTSNHEESPDPLKDEVEIDAMYIRRNGRTLFDESQGAPT